MKPRLVRLAAGAALAAGLLAAHARAARAVADIQPPEQRRAIVETAERLAAPAQVAALPDELPSPFSPAGFGRGDPASAARSDERPAGPAAPAIPQTDRDLLATIAGKIPATGTLVLRGKPLLISGVNRIEVGSLFTVVYNGQEYELELVAIDRTTFTVRYKGEEFTRPIKQVKSP